MNRKLGLTIGFVVAFTAITLPAFFIFLGDRFGDLEVMLRKKDQAPVSISNPPLEKEELSEEEIYNTKFERQIESIVDSLSMEEKVAQMFMFYYPGHQLSEEHQDEISRIKPGGIIIMGSNVSNEAQLLAFTESIRAHGSLEIDLHLIKPFIAVDQEGGVVRRINWDNTGGVKLWEGMGTDKVCEEAVLRAETLNNAGININLAPVVDVGSEKQAFINNRTISNNPDNIINLAAKFVECSQEAGISSVIKHFPGHGITPADSHFVSPAIDLEYKDWEEKHGRVFKEIISETKPDFVMTGHLELSKIDQKPATLSNRLIEDILRDKYQFDGLVITDDMAQLHYSTKISHQNAIKEAINAGNDIIMYINTGQYSREQLIEMTVESVSLNEIEETRINESVKRNLRLKLREKRA